MSPAKARKTMLDDEQHAHEVAGLMNQNKRWFTHDGEVTYIDAMSAPHALSAFRKLIDYAQGGLIGIGFRPYDVVVSPLGVALRMQAFGTVAVEAELQALTQRGPAGRRRLRVSQVLAAVEAIDDEVKADADNTKYVDPVDYAVRLTELINERLT